MAKQAAAMADNTAGPVEKYLSDSPISTSCSADIGHAIAPTPAAPCRAIDPRNHANQQFGSYQKRESPKWLK